MKDPFIDVTTPMASILLDLQRTWDPVYLRTKEGSEKAAQYMKLKLMGRGLTVDSVYRVGR